MAKINKLFSKIVLVLFLLMIVIGFTVPGFINSSQNDNSVLPQAEPRICQTDSDCYLLCNDLPLAVLCSQNLCWQNSCEEYALYPFNNHNPLTFILNIILDGKKVNLKERSNLKDLFVVFNDQEVQLFSSGLSFAQVLDKVRIQLAGTCLIINRIRYCDGGDPGTARLQFVFNGEQIYDAEQKIPNDGDVVDIIYDSSFEG